MLETLTNYVTTNFQLIHQFFKEHPTTGYCLQGLLLTTSIYFLYLEQNPRIGKIFIRPDSNGNSRFRLQGIIPILKYPFQSLEFWKPKNWDINIYIFTGIGTAIYTIIKVSCTKD